MKALQPVALIGADGRDTGRTRFEEIEIPDPAPGPVEGHRVVITVTCECGHVLGTYLDAIEEKYPFWCEECDETKKEGKFPWKITTAFIIDGRQADAPAVLTWPGSRPDADEAIDRLASQVAGKIMTELNGTLFEIPFRFAEELRQAYPYGTRSVSPIGHGPTGPRIESWINSDGRITLLLQSGSLETVWRAVLIPATGDPAIRYT